MRKPSKIQCAVDAFAGIRQQYIDFGLRLSDLVRTLIESESIQIHALECRAKTIESFREKLQRPGKIYAASPSDLPDLCGLRLILYYPDDVQKAAKIIRREFRINEEQSGSTADRLAPNEFGYLSLHLIASLGDSRCSLPEWKPFQGLIAEVQIRTVLQHAWAAISHALQYKRESEVPMPLRRRLFRLSGLLEIADDEFAALNVAHQKLVTALTGASPSEFGKQPINLLSLGEFMMRSDLPRRIAKIAFSAGFSDMDSEDAPDRSEFMSMDDASSVVAICTAANLSTISELEATLTRVLSRSKDFFRRLILESKSTDWWGNAPFFVQLLIILANPRSFSVDQLESEFDWTKNNAETVIAAANGIARLPTPKREHEKKSI